MTMLFRGWRIIVFVLFAWLSAGMFPLRAETINVPLLSKSAKGIDFGFASDAQKYVFAVRIENLAKQKNLLIGLYIDADGDGKTGRRLASAKDKLDSLGYDLQLNIRCDTRRLAAYDWSDGLHYSAMQVYTDDYQIEPVGDILYIALRKEAVGKFKIGRKWRIRITGHAENNPRQLRGGGPVNVEKTIGKLTPAFEFHSFDEGNQTRIRLAEAWEIPRKDGIRVWNTFGERYREEESMPPVAGVLKSLSIAGARGERESWHFALSAETPLKTLIVRPSALAAESGTGRIPQSAMEVFYGDFITTSRGESYCDALLGNYRPSRSRNHFVTVDLAIPRDIPAGIYAGTFSVTADGRELAPIPVRLEVFDFQLPETRCFSTTFTLSRSSLSRFYKQSPPFVDKFLKQEFNDEYDLMDKHRIGLSVAQMPKMRLMPDGTLKTDWKQFDALAKRHFARGKNTLYKESTLQIGSKDNVYPRFSKIAGHELKFDTPEFEQLLRLIVREVHAHHKAAGLLDRTLFIIWDEPTGEAIDKIIKIAKIIRSTAPGFRLGVYIGHHEPRLDGLVDFYVTKFDTVAKSIKRADSFPRQAGIYNSLCTDSFRCPVSDLRGYFWLADYYKLLFYHYSEINNFAWVSLKDGRLLNRLPRYVWFYPDLFFGGPTIPSIRLFFIRDGLDDADYLKLYRDLLAGAEPAPEIAGAFPKFDRLNNVEFKCPSNRELEKVRLILAREIVRLKKGRPAAVPAVK